MVCQQLMTLQWLGWEGNSISSTQQRNRVQREGKEPFLQWTKMMTEIKVKLNQNVLGTCNIGKNRRTRVLLCWSRAFWFSRFSVNCTCQCLLMEKILYSYWKQSDCTVHLLSCLKSALVELKAWTSSAEAHCAFPRHGWEAPPCAGGAQGCRRCWTSRTRAPLLLLLFTLNNDFWLKAWEPAQASFCSQARTLSSLPHWAAEASTGGAPLQGPVSAALPTSSPPNIHDHTAVGNPHWTDTEAGEAKEVCF